MFGFLKAKKPVIQNTATMTTELSEVAKNMMQNNTPILAYRTNGDLRAVCRQEIEALEHWARRLIHEVFTEHYGHDYLTYKNENAEPLIKGEIVARINRMREEIPARFPRPIDAMFLGDIKYILCKKTIYDTHFKSALDDAYPQGNEEARIFLDRIEVIRNKLSHSNPISAREAEQVICYCHDFIDSLKAYYKATGKEKDYNVPTFIEATDSLGNIFLPSEGGGSLRRYIDTSTPVRGCDIDIKLRVGDIYGLSIIVDPAFDAGQYSVMWVVMSGLMGDNYKKKWENTTHIDIPIEIKMVGSYLDIRCYLTSKKEWHKHNTYDDSFEFNIHTILPPIEDNY